MGNSIVETTWSENNSRIFGALDPKYWLLNDLQLLTVPTVPQEGIPILTLSSLLLGSLTVIGTHLFSQDASSSEYFGTSLMLLSLLIFPLEHMRRRKRLRQCMASVYPLIDEIGTIHRSLASYLLELDQRTSKYFHCVTSTKVTTYFTLRQIEAALQEVGKSLLILFAFPSIRNYQLILERLRGDLEYRDGFEFNRGELHRIPITKIAALIQELIHDLERSIEMLEEEIKITP